MTRISACFGLDPLSPREIYADSVRLLCDSPPSRSPGCLCPIGREPDAAGFIRLKDKLIGESVVVVARYNFHQPEEICSTCGGVSKIGRVHRRGTSYIKGGTGRKLVRARRHHKIRERRARAEREGARPRRKEDKGRQRSETPKEARGRGAQGERGRPGTEGGEAARDKGSSGRQKARSDFIWLI